MSIMGGLGGLMGGLSGALGGGFGSLGFSSGFPAGYFKGFALSVDAISGDPTLGGGWQTMSLGSMEMHTNELPAGGYIRTSLREVERISYGEVTLARAWAPGTSARITEWFSWANRNGGTSVAITVEVPAASEAGIGGLGASLMSSLAVLAGLDTDDLPGKKFNIIFRECLPKQWGAPQLTAGLVNHYTNGPQQPTSLETLTFTFSGYKVEAFSGATPLIDQSVATEEKVEPFKLVIIPNTGGVTTRMLASMSNWTASQSGFSAIMGFGAVSNATAAMIAGYAAMLDSVELYLPPASIRVEKESSWRQKKSMKAKGSGPVSYLGPKPMKMSFNFLLKTNNKDPFSAGGLIGGLSSGGGLLGAALGGLGLSDSMGFGKPRSVMDDLKKLLALCEAYSSGLFSNASTPPLVMLLWGKFCSPLMYITDLSADIVRFGPDGTPSKAIGSLSLKQYPTSTSSTNPTSGGLAPEMAETVLQGDTLAHLAYRTYQNPMNWRDVATYNGITDPLRVTTGRRLRMPSPEILPWRTEGGGLSKPDDVDEPESYEDD